MKTLKKFAAKTLTVAAIGMTSVAVMAVTGNVFFGLVAGVAVFSQVVDFLNS